MRMICEKKPRIAAKLIMDDKKIIKEFFAGIFTWNCRLNMQLSVSLTRQDKIYDSNCKITSSVVLSFFPLCRRTVWNSLFSFCAYIIDCMDRAT